MSDDSARAEEERIQRAMNRKARSSMVVKPTHSIEPGPPTSTFSQKPKTAAVPEKPKPIAEKPIPAEKPKPVAEKPKPAPAATTHVSFSQVQNSGARSAEIENLQLKKRTILGTIATTRRDLDDVRAEIAKLKHKEAELVSLLEKREQSVHQLSQDIEELEKKDKDHSEDIKRQKEEEKAKRLREEIERRRQEEVEEERKRIEEEEKKLLNPQPVYSPRSEDEADDGVNAEEQRIMRAMSRPGKSGAIAPGRVSNVKTVANNPPSKPAISDAERQRIAEENRKKEEEQRAQQERDLQQRVAHLQAPGGVKKTFISAQVYDFDAEVKFISDFTNFEEIPITTPMDNNFTFSVTWNVTPGPHFYLFKINGKAEINKNLPTGLAPNGSLMNKVDC